MKWNAWYCPPKRNAWNYIIAALFFFGVIRDQWFPGWFEIHSSSPHPLTGLIVGCIFLAVGIASSRKAKSAL
jgi:hypothetical protein